MVKPRYLIAALLLLALTVAPLTGWPGKSAAAYAQTTGTQRETTFRTRAVWPFSLFTVVSSNENERKDKEERQGREDNQSSDDNEDDNCCAPPPPPPPPAPSSSGGSSGPPPAAASNQASGCLRNGGTVSLSLPDGSVTAKVFQDNVNVRLERVDSGSIPPPSDGYIGSLVFRVSASPCGGSDYGSLPNEANLGVNYNQGAVSGRDEDDLRLMYWDGQRWSATPKQTADPGANYVSATISALGVYALSGD